MWVGANGGVRAGTPYWSDLCVLGALCGERLLDWNIAALLLSKGPLPPRTRRTPRRVGGASRDRGAVTSWAAVGVIGVFWKGCADSATPEREESCSSCALASPNLHESEGIPVAPALHRQYVMTDVQAIDAITDGIIGAAIKVHRLLGPGLLHSAYLVCLTQELVAGGYQVEVEKPISLSYGDDTIDCAFRADLMVDEQVIVEVKSLERCASVHRAQLLTYLKLTNCRVGLLINFNVPVLKDGIRRVANDLRDDQGNLV